MKSIIIRRLDELKEMTLENSKLKVSSISFKITIPAGATQGVIPIDDIDINHDIVFLYINTRDGNDEAVVTQELGERPVVTINMYETVTTVTGFILKNVIVAGDASTETVAGSVLIKDTLPPDRIIQIDKSLSGKMIKDHTLTVDAIDFSGLFSGEFIEDDTLSVSKISDQENLIIKGLFDAFISDYDYIDINPLGGRQLIVNSSYVDSRIVRINLLQDIAKDVNNAPISILRNAGSSKILTLPDGTPVEKLKMGPFDVVEFDDVYMLVTAAAARDDDAPVIIPTVVMDQINSNTSRIAVVEPKFDDIRDEIAAAMIDMRLVKGSTIIPSTPGSWTAGTGVFTTQVAIAGVSADTLTIVEIHEDDQLIAANAVLRTSSTEGAGFITVKVTTVPTADIRINYAVIRTSMQDDMALLTEIRSKHDTVIALGSSLSNMFGTMNTNITTLSDRMDDFVAMDEVTIDNLLNISNHFDKVIVTNKLFIPSTVWLDNSDIPGYSKKVVIPVNTMNANYNVMIHTDVANRSFINQFGLDYAVAGDQTISFYAKNNVTSDITLSYTAIHRYGTKVDVLDPPTPPVVQNVSSSSIECPEYGVNIQVKLGWGGEWFDLPHTFSGLTASTTYFVYARFKPTASNNGSLDSEKTTFTTLSAGGVDTTNAPGPKTLLHGTLTAGFFGELPASELYVGTDLALACGVAVGNSQNSNEPWLKFAWNGDIIFTPKKPLRNSISYDALVSANCVSGAKTISKNAVTYTVSLWSAALSSPALDGAADKGAINSMWNKLLLPIHEQTMSETWAYPQFVGGTAIPQWYHTYGTGANGLYTDADLIKNSINGDGANVWCKELANTNASNAMIRGGSGVSFTNAVAKSTATLAYGWLPVLKVVV